MCCLSGGQPTSCKCVQYVELTYWMCAMCSYGHVQGWGSVGIPHHCWHRGVRCQLVAFWDDTKQFLNFSFLCRHVMSLLHM